MTDDELEADIESYLERVGTQNPDMAEVEFDFQEGNGRDFGLDHARLDHGISREHIEQVMFELEAPEEKRSTHEPNRAIFWGHTRTGQALSVVCLDGVTEDGRRWLGLITAFPESEDEWRRRR